MGDLVQLLVFHRKPPPVPYRAQAHLPHRVKVKAYNPVSVQAVPQANPLVVAPVFRPVQVPLLLQERHRVPNPVEDLACLLVLSRQVGSPRELPSATPTVSPSVSPSASPSIAPSESPSILPSESSSPSPSLSPSASTSFAPSSSPSSTPSEAPSSLPTGEPSAQPSTIRILSQVLLQALSQAAFPMYLQVRHQVLLPALPLVLHQVRFLQWFLAQRTTPSSAPPQLRMPRRVLKPAEAPVFLLLLY
jgi:hypothetical protein